MAETKYSLYTFPTNKAEKVYNQPWYKERLKTKYIKSLGPQDTSAFLHGNRWTFIKDGLDDFRDGLPPAIDNADLTIKGSKGLQPNIRGSSSGVNSVKQPAVRNRFNKHEVCFARATPLQQQRREHIDEIEFGLTQHPLALYPHLEECLPPDVFEDVVDILDPEMNIADDVADEDDEFSMSESDGQSSRKGKVAASDDEEKDGESAQPRNCYRWLPRKDDSDRDKKDRKKLMEKRSATPAEDEHINQVTKEFCDWVASLGGDTNNIEESTITSLFASGYETKPALSVPIHVVELTNVPPELRMSANVPTQVEKKEEVNNSFKKPADWTYSGQYEPSWVKFRYGAWYLPTKTWKRMDADAQLEDPKTIKDKEMSEAKKKSNELDTELAPMHGAQAFMEFMDTHENKRRPEFLDHVSEIQEQQRHEEEAKIEAEKLKHKKLTYRQ